MKSSITPQEALERITKIYKENSELFAQLQDYGERVRALSEELHVGKITETFNVPVTEMLVAATLDVRETPKSLDKQIAQLQHLQGRVSQVVYDRASGMFYVLIDPSTISTADETPTTT